MRMKRMVIFEPAMCCSTGVCGPSVDKELLRVSTMINNLKKAGIMVERYNLSSNPQIFVDNTAINKIINTDGVDTLPVVMVDGDVVKTKGYPTNEEFIELLDVKEHIKASRKSSGGCCGPEGCC